MGGYAKLFTRILDSTVWRENNPTRLLWITMLALADRDGNVFCTIPGLADRARITLEECEYALNRFLQPDKYSWSREEEGRRIKIIEGGWSIINHAKFRQMMSVEEIREKTRVRVARHRAKKKNCNGKSLQNVTAVTFNASNDIAEASSKAKAEATKTSNIQTTSSSSKKPDDDVEKILSILKSSPATTGRVSPKDRDIAAELLKSFSVEQIEVGILLASARRNGNGKINSLAYFKDAIAESAVDPNMTGEYVEYLRRTIKKRHVEAK
jgi:hypothetical protein